MQTQTLITGVISLFIVYRVYQRIRRSIGWQEIRSGKMMLRIGLLLLVGLVFFAEGATHPTSLVSNLVGLALGAALAYAGVALTSFERREGKWFYRANEWIGLTVTVLFIGRLAYRLYTMLAMAQPAAGMTGKPGAWSQWQGTTQGWTSGLMLIMFAYYIVTYWTMLRKLKTM